MFWKLYPPRRGRREGKALALVAWQKLQPDAALCATITAAVHAYASSTDLPVDAVRWLKGRRWEDEAGVAKAPPKPKITMTPEERARWDAKQAAR